MDLLLKGEKLNIVKRFETERQKLRNLNMIIKFVHISFAFIISLLFFFSFLYILTFLF